MNEADTPNIGPFIETLNSADMPQPQQTSCPFYSVVPMQNRAISQLPLLAPAADKQCQEDVSYQDSVVETNRETEITSNSESLLELNEQQLDESKPGLDWVAEPESEKEALIDSEFKKLLTLNEELRSANNNLYEQVEELRAALCESEGALQWQKKRSTVAEAMLNQQAQELTAAQEQIKSLFQQLETALSTVQTQETVIENYKSQLEINQQRLALLERECALIQTKYNEQSHQLLQSENACRELRTRLMRQQRQTLQFKAALEKCLETPVPSYDSLDNTANSNDTGSRLLRNSNRTSSVFPNPQPIRPWCVEQESFENNANIFRQEYPTPTQSSPANLSAQESTPNLKQPPAKSEIDDSITSQKVSFSESSSLDEQVDGLIQLFFAAQARSASPPPAEKDTEGVEDVEDVEDDDETVMPVLETVATSLEDVEDDDENVAPVLETVATSLENDEEKPVTAILPSRDTDSKEDGDYWLEASPLSPQQLPGTASPQNSSNDNITKPNSPSPLLYPERPPKRRKTLASVELPNFRPNSQ
ncbi:MAG: hypothetical protein HXY43_15235 [Fischerella sp.]|jgi:hypothetical protein|uniref:hypothetical protein n=1 Tax=Fischerella sp. TaxID=1191 RepID=UPI00182C223D|nr:hypothetical protein [Fischerella sp.]NWF60569.1 hypothetical protein [Fischerella sp.]